jgi:hypothetical protein
MTADTTGIAFRVDEIDLEPIVYKLMHPHPGEEVLTLAEADQRVRAYRCFLKLCAWYPEESIAPSGDIDEVWHMHILDTAKYPADCDDVFGFYLHHFPYLGLRGEADVIAWRAAYVRTRALFRQHFGIELPNGQAAQTCHKGGSSCADERSLCSNEECEKASHNNPGSQRPRPDRSAICGSPPRPDLALARR